MANGLLVGKDILFMGDDDLTSLMCALLSKNLAPDHFDSSRIQVLDIDDRYLEMITQTSDKFELGILCEHYDAREELPEELQECHDVLITDPPYTLEGLKLFLCRGVEGFDKERSCEALLSYPRRPAADNWRLQSAVLELGFSFFHVMQGFNQYHGAAMHANQSNLYHLQFSPEMRTSNQDESAHPIYTGDTGHKISHYQCKGCGRDIAVGPGKKWKTITALKDSGCPDCGGKNFDRQSGKKISNKRHWQA